MASSGDSSAVSIPRVGRPAPWHAGPPAVLDGRDGALVRQAAEQETIARALIDVAAEFWRDNARLERALNWPPER